MNLIRNKIYLKYIYTFRTFILIFRIFQATSDGKVACVQCVRVGRTQVYIATGCSRMSSSTATGHGCRRPASVALTVLV